MATTAAPPAGGSPDALNIILRPKRVEYYLPFMIGVWLDAVCLGLLFVAFGAWLSSVRKTDRPLVRYLVLYLMAASVMMSGFMIGQWFLVYVHGYGDFMQLFDTHRESIPESHVVRGGRRCKLMDSPARGGLILCHHPRPCSLLFRLAGLESAQAASMVAACVDTFLVRSYCYTKQDAL